MGSRYAFIVLMAFLEHHLSRGDYRRPGYRDPRPKAAGSSAGTPSRRFASTTSAQDHERTAVDGS
jgi:hypothetical protein